MQRLIKIAKINVCKCLSRSWYYADILSIVARKCTICRSWTCFNIIVWLARIGFDAAENETSKIHYFLFYVSPNFGIRKKYDQALTYQQQACALLADVRWRLSDPRAVRGVEPRPPLGKSATPTPRFRRHGKRLKTSHGLHPTASRCGFKIYQMLIVDQTRERNDRKFKSYE